MQAEFDERPPAAGPPSSGGTLSDEEMERICAMYDEKEREARMATGEADFYNPAAPAR